MGYSVSHCHVLELFLVPDLEMGPSKILDWGLVLVQVPVRWCCSRNPCLALLVESYCRQVTELCCLQCSLGCSHYADSSFR